MKKRVTKKRGLRGPHEAMELELYVDNEEPLYRRKLAIEAALDKKVKSGKFDKTKAPKAFRYVVDEAARKYAKEFRMSPRAFTAADRNHVAAELTKGYMSERGLKGLRGCGTSGCHGKVKSRGMRGLGSTTKTHVADARRYMNVLERVLDEQRSSPRACPTAYRNINLINYTVGELSASMFAASGRQNLSKHPATAPLAERYFDLTQQANVMQRRIGEACVAPSSSVGLSGARKKRAAKRKKRS